jgi:hypothetical protein
LQSGNLLSQSYTTQTKLTAKYIVRGIVKDASGSPVVGAAILVGKETAFTDSDGTFFVRLRKKNVVTLKVVPEDFTAPGNWQVISAPDGATPELKDGTTVVNIEVSRVV